MVDDKKEYFRKMGEIFEYPKCCVEEFISSYDKGIYSGLARGSVLIRRRTETEIKEISQKIKSSFDMNWNPGPKGNGQDFMYVPCTECMEKEKTMGRWQKYK